MVVASGENESDVANTATRTGQANLLLKSRERLPSALRVHPGKILRIHVKEFAGYGRDFPTLAGALHAVELLLALAFGKEVMQTLAVFEKEGVQVNQETGYDPECDRPLR